MASNNNDDLWTIICDNETFQRHEFACGVYQDRYIVIAGGCCSQSNKILQSAAMYDVATQSVISLPDVRKACSCEGVVMNDYFYVNLRIDRQDKIHFMIYRINLSKKNKWEYVFRRRGSHNIHDMTTDGKRLFYAGDKHLFFLDGRPLSHLQISATKKIPYDTSKFYPIILIDGKIYNIEFPNGEPRKTFIFDIATESWSDGPTLPAMLFELAAFAIDRWIIFRGVDRKRGGHMFIYDTHTQTWTKADIKLSSPRSGYRSVKVGSQIISFGGYDQHPMTSIHIKHIISDWTWSILKPYILLRKLVDHERATPVKKPKKRKQDAKTTNVNAVVEKVFTEMPLDMFIYTLKFLK